MEISYDCDISSKLNDSLCRVCLSSPSNDDENKCIFTSDMTHENLNLTRFSEKLQLYGGIEVKQGDGFPTKICNKCISNLSIAHKFRTQCQESDKKLRLLSKQLTSKNNEILTERRKDIFEEGAKEVSSSQVRSVIDKSISSEKLQENNAPAQSIVKKLILDNVRRSWKNCSKKTVGSVNADSSEIVPSKTENLISTVARETDENSQPRKEEQRSRRLVVFGRMTSMENLKNRKELQRRYVRKTILLRNKNSEDQEISRFNKNHHASVKPIASDLKIARYKCTKCCRSYDNKKSLAEHQYSHDPEKFSCDRCDERFGKLVEFLEHAKTHELKEKLKPASCKICDKNFRKFFTMVRHLNVHKRQYPRAVYAILKDIREKRKREKFEFYNDNPSSGSITEEKDISKDIYDNSLGYDESNVEKCTETLKDCNFTTNSLNYDSNDTNNTELSNSSRNVLEDMEIPSDDRTAIKLINNWIREELDSDNEGKGFPCDICNKSYVTKKSLLKHKSKIHDVSSSCNICLEYCNCNDDIPKNIHNRQSTKLYHCENCDKTFDDETRLQKHRKIHSRVNKSEDKNFKRFLCHICSKTFRQNNGLMFHMRTHTGYKPHVCKFCGRGFTSNSNCTNHERTHTGDRPFVCHFCSAAFAKSCTLKAHITTHTGEANYHCKTCDKSFRRLKYLKEHRFTHTGEKPYACKICGTAYSHSGSLFVHEKKCKAQQDNSQARGENFAVEKSVIIQQQDYEINDIHVNGRENKIFGIDQHEINQQNDFVQSCQSSLPTNARNFSIIEQMFQS